MRAVGLAQVRGLGGWGCKERCFLRLLKERCLRLLKERFLILVYYSILGDIRLWVGPRIEHIFSSLTTGWM